MSPMDLMLTPDLPPPLPLLWLLLSRPWLSTGGILAVLFGIEQQKIADAERLYDKLVSKVRLD